MRHLTLIAVASAAAMFACIASAQQPATPPAAPAATPPAPPPALPLYGPPVTAEQAKKAVAAAVSEAKKTPYLYTFAVVDPSGELVYFEKMDGAPTSSNDIGIGKAWTAATFKRPSKAYFDIMEAGHSFVAALHPRMTASAGGIPLMVDGKIVGAIGVSGGPNGLIDAVAAQAGADALK